METVRSQDGTPLAYERTGDGPSLVLVHGTTADHTRWARILPALAERFTVCAMDRRGRGGSGDASPYAIEREFEDVAAVADAVADAAGEPAVILGHSYGALCSLEAALRARHLRKLVLYEPPIPAGVEIYPAEVVDRIQTLFAAGDRAGVVTTFFRDVARVPPTELELLQSLPNWPARVAAAHTIPREIVGSETYRFDPARFRRLNTPTLLLLGGDSPPFLTAATRTVHAALPESRIVVLPGQQHIAMDAAPDLFTGEVIRFLTEA